MRLRAALLMLALPALGAAQTRIISTQPDSVSLTIYRDFFALITETRTVDLPAEAVTLEFDGVVDTLIPQSAVIAETGRTVEEGNYDFDRLSTANLLRKSIGRKVTLTRTNRATGKASQVEATLISANDGGVIFNTGAGAEALKCSGLPEKMTFEQIPADLKLKPALSIHLAAGTPGKRQVRVSYIAQGFGWAADYVARVDADANRMNLQGWLTLRNFTSARFESAQVQVVAGRLNLLDVAGRGSSTLGDSSNILNEESLAYARSEKLDELQSSTDLSNFVADYFYGCYPYGPAVFPGARDKLPMLMRVDSITSEDIGEDLAEVIVSGFRAPLAERENLADYQMYRIPWKTALGARQTKQVAFLHQPDVTIERFYGIRMAPDAEADMDGDISQLAVHVGWKNTRAYGLGEPLPGGIVRVFDRNGDGSVFAGEDSIEDTPVGVPSELSIGQSPDVAVLLNSPSDDAKATLWSLLTRRVYLPIDLSISNAKSRPVLVEIRQGSMAHDRDLHVSRATLRPGRKAGDYAWRFTVPAHGEQRLSYKVGVRLDREDD
jgi:hypothetical protein